MNLLVKLRNSSEGNKDGTENDDICLICTSFKKFKDELLAFLGK